jgi:hypothetical protein
MDVDDCANEDKTSIAIHTQDDTQNKENHEDNCTPFCHCACCVAISFIFQTNLVEKIATIYCTPIKFSTLDINFSSNNINAIWQPPKFAV